MSKYKVNNGVSINHASNRDFLKAMMSKGIIGVDNAAAPVITAPNINAPLGALIPLFVIMFDLKLKLE